MEMDDCCERMPSKPQWANNYIVTTIYNKALFSQAPIPLYGDLEPVLIFSNFFMLFFRFPTKFFLSS